MTGFRLATELADQLLRSYGAELKQKALDTLETLDTPHTLELQML